MCILNAPFQELVILRHGCVWSCHCSAQGSSWLPTTCRAGFEFLTMTFRLSTSVPPLPLPHSQPHPTHHVYPIVLDSWVSDQGSQSLLHAFMCPVPSPQDVLFLSYMNWLMAYPVLLGWLRNPAILPTAGSISPLPSIAFYLFSFSDVLVGINSPFLSNSLAFCWS